MIKVTKPSKNTTLKIAGIALAVSSLIAISVAATINIRKHK